jgi:hypothetical protein
MNMRMMVPKNRLMSSTPAILRVAKPSSKSEVHACRRLHGTESDRPEDFARAAAEVPLQPAGERPQGSVGGSLAITQRLRYN